MGILRLSNYSVAILLPAQLTKTSLLSCKNLNCFEFLFIIYRSERDCQDGFFVLSCLVLTARRYSCLMRSFAYLQMANHSGKDGFFCGFPIFSCFSPMIQSLEPATYPAVLSYSPAQRSAAYHPPSASPPSPVSCYPPLSRSYLSRSHGRQRWPVRSPGFPGLRR